MKQNLKRELKAFYQAAPPMPRADLIAELKLRAKRNALTPPRDPSLYRFIRTQIRFLNRKLLVLQFLLICLYAVYTLTVLQDNQTFLLLVPISPPRSPVGKRRAFPFFPLWYGGAGISLALFSAADPLGKAYPDRSG